MKRNKVPTRFQPETRFEVIPAPAVPFRGTQETELEHLKARLLRELLEQTPDKQHNALVRRAANEAAGLAWFTPFPLLFFPGLLEEKARAVRQQDARQRYVRDRSENLLEEAVAVTAGDSAGAGPSPDPASSNGWRPPGNPGGLLV